MLQDAQQRIGAAVAAVADAPADHGVVIHCFAGKDRTGLVAALLLSLAGVPDEDIAADYAESDPGVDALNQSWFAAARDDRQLLLRRRISISPHATMLEVLRWLHEEAGGPEAYLTEAGLSEAQLDALRARLVED